MVGAAAVIFLGAGTAAAGLAFFLLVGAPRQSPPGQ